MEKKNTSWGRICFSLLLLSLTNWFPHVCAFLNPLVQNCQVKVVVAHFSEISPGPYLTQHRQCEGWGGVSHAYNYK